MTSAPTIRDARPDDLPAILQMVRDLAAFERMADQVVFDPDEFGRHVFGPDPVVTVNIAEVDGEVAGMALWFRIVLDVPRQAGDLAGGPLRASPASAATASAAPCCATSARLTDGRVEWNVLDWNTGAIAAYDAIGAKPDDGGWIAYRWSPSS